MTETKNETNAQRQRRALAGDNCCNEAPRSALDPWHLRTDGRLFDQNGLPVGRAEGRYFTAGELSDMVREMLGRVAHLMDDAAGELWQHVDECSFAGEECPLLPTAVAVEKFLAAHEAARKLGGPFDGEPGAEP